MRVVQVQVVQGWSKSILDWGVVHWSKSGPLGLLDYQSNGVVQLGGYLYTHPVGGPPIPYDQIF